MSHVYFIGVSGKMTTEGDEDDNFGTETSQKVHSYIILKTFVFFPNLVVVFKSQDVFFFCCLVANQIILTAI